LVAAGRGGRAGPANQTRRRPETMQLESAHYMRLGDLVRHDNGRVGTVMESMALYARVRWDEEGEEEVDQLDPRITVTERATRE
jgi:hypothetical protein